MLPKRHALGRAIPAGRILQDRLPLRSQLRYADGLLAERIVRVGFGTGNGESITPLRGDSDSVAAQTSRGWQSRSKKKRKKRVLIGKRVDAALRHRPSS